MILILASNSRYHYSSSVTHWKTDLKDAGITVRVVLFQSFYVLSFIVSQNARKMRKIS